MCNDWYTLHKHVMVFSQVAYPYIKAVSDPVHTGRWFSFFLLLFPILVGWFSFSFSFFNTGGVILLSMPGIFMWSKDGLPPFAVREMTGVRFQILLWKKYFMPSRARESGFGENHWIPNSTSSPKTSDMLQWWSKTTSTGILVDLFSSVLM